MPTDPDFDPAFYADNRRRFLEGLGEDAALLFNPPLQVRNSDVEHRYRANSDVLYLTGFAEPEAAVLLRPGADQPFVMFVLPRDPKKEQWTGRRAGIEGACAVYGADAAFPLDELPEQLTALLQGWRTLHYRFADDPERDRLLVGAVGRARRKAKENGLDVPDAFIDPARLLHEQRLFKTDAELAVLRQAAAITGDAHRAAMEATAPGVREYELEAVIEYTFRRSGGVGPGYGTIVGGGDNANILHYTANNDTLRAGDLVCVDAGCEYRHYTADVTRTWPVGGRFSPAQRGVYAAVLSAQKAAIAAVKPGNTFQDVHAAATRALAEAMVDLGLLDGDVDELIEAEKHKKYYPHGTSHWLGLDVHDVGAYAGGGKGRTLQPGMVLTIEPGLYIPADDEEAPEELRGIGVRIEDDVAVTAAGNEVLTADTPKEIDDLERLVGRAARAAK